MPKAMVERTTQNSSYKDYPWIKYDIFAFERRLLEHRITMKLEEKLTSENTELCFF